MVSEVGRNNFTIEGSAQLLGLIVWKIQKQVVPNERDSKLKNSDREIENLKRMRHEDAKANDEVVGIFAAQKQSWFSERRKLRQQIGALLIEIRVFEKKKDIVVSVMAEKEGSDLLAYKLSMEIAEIHKDLEQKDKILSAMLRKSKLDIAEKMLKEVKLSNARRKQAEQEIEKWKVVS